MLPQAMQQIMAVKMAVMLAVKMAVMSPACPQLVPSFVPSFVTSLVTLVSFKYFLITQKSRRLPHSRGQILNSEARRIRIATL